MKIKGGAWEMEVIKSFVTIAPPEIATTKKVSKNI
jgi:hypothetical protein